MLTRSIAAAALAFTCFFAAPAFAEDAKINRMITLSGHGEVRMAPDIATVTSGVVTQAATAREALTANNAAMEKVIGALTGAGIEKKDIQTSNFMVQPRYDYNNNTQPPRLIGYDVSNSVTVIVRKIDGLGAVLDAVVSSGSNQINGIAFQVSKPDAAKDEARKLASADAARKAKLYAETLSVKLGKIISISEGGGYQPSVPVQAKMMRAEAADASVPIAQGEQIIAVDVNIAWEIE
jgi:hypothetical protein